MKQLKLTQKTQALMGIKADDSQTLLAAKKELERIRDLFQKEVIGGVQNVMDDNESVLANYGASHMFVGYLENLDLAVQDVENQLKNMIGEYDYIAEQATNGNKS